MSYQFMPASESDAPQVLALIRDRIQWMRETGLRQWDAVDYWGFFPESYFFQAIADQRLYVVEETGGGRVVCAGVLSFQDPDWTDGVPAVYLHNFAGARDAPGAGGFFLERGEDYTRAHGRTRFRLDCMESNKKLNQYYERRGFRAVGRVEKRGYVGVQREKPLT